MVFFFYRRRDKEIEALGKMGSAAAGVLPVLQYTILTAIFVRALGSGANVYSMIGLLVVCVIAAIVTLWAPWDLIQSRWPDHVGEQSGRGRKGFATIAVTHPIRSVTGRAVLSVESGALSDRLRLSCERRLRSLVFLLNPEIEVGRVTQQPRHHALWHVSCAPQLARHPLRLPISNPGGDDCWLCSCALAAVECALSKKASVASRCLRLSWMDRRILAPLPRCRDHS